MHSVHLRSGVLWLMEPWGPPQLCNYAIASGAMKQGMAEMSEVAREAAEAAQASVCSAGGSKQGDKYVEQCKITALPNKQLLTHCSPTEASGAWMRCARMG